MIELIHISKSFGQYQVLHELTFTFEDGKVYGIVGENGAGKTTLFRCIAGLETASGQINANLEPLKNHLGYLTSDPYFLSKLTGEEYIYLLTDARGKSIHNIDERNIFELPLKEYASSYSTGMKKKLALTATLLQDNSFYILDEPFNGIDLQSSIILTEIILRLKAMNKTVLISSHIFSTLKDTCDEILVIEAGRISKTVKKEHFGDFEEEMKEKILKKDIDKLWL
ncbi:MAG: transporter ATP-binding protein [Sphingobacterium sp.]|jgi:ABC-2 type transport system ATP-binding protein|uniref:ABC transporter ATP-binding protein n=1 Tax=Sphingobacterium sp. CZ-UAM TaxID=1933868 RepID=UPI0009840E67|nr:ATP-binding cassette domain-containing protein [Sphingobacterium sp. CZ-UAM]MDF2517597.1 transporter ATP-binding protein [Sphingobacterium sp.]OOG16208.1 ABC transporter ATP-binding protein [Sphingobacterium sp. CZ-UAM]